MDRVFWSVTLLLMVSGRDLYAVRSKLSSLTKADAPKGKYFGAANPGGYHCDEHNKKFEQLVGLDFPLLGLFDEPTIKFAKDLIKFHDPIYKLEPGLVPFTQSVYLALRSSQGREARKEMKWSRRDLAMAKAILPALDVPLNIPADAAGRVPLSRWLESLPEKEQQFFRDYFARSPIEHVQRYMQQVPKNMRATVLMLAHYLHLYDILAPNSDLPVDSYRYIAALEKESERTYGGHRDLLRTNYDFLMRPENRIGVLKALADKLGIQGFAPPHRNVEDLLVFVSKNSQVRGAHYRAVLRMYKMLAEGESARNAIVAANRQLEKELGHRLPDRAYDIPSMKHP